MDRRNTDIFRRGHLLSAGERGSGPVVYWMSREQRIEDNWALLYAQQEAVLFEKGLVVVFCFSSEYPGANSRHYLFMLRGLVELQLRFEELNIGFDVLVGDPVHSLCAFIEENNPHQLITDFDPLRVKQHWKKELIQQVTLPVVEVDAHNIIPAWLISDKKEYAAYTIRPKINRLLGNYLTEFPEIIRHPVEHNIVVEPIDVQYLMQGVTTQLPEVTWCTPGYRAALSVAQHFVQEGLARYALESNDPCKQGQSGMSPYLHFGQFSAQRLALLVQDAPVDQESKEKFLEELVVRRELADNFCFFEPNYDTVAGFPDWAKKSLEQHRKDSREYLYTFVELEHFQTHDPLWNACQQDLVQQGKLHGYLRMYWAKKILEWTVDPEQALEFALSLNDFYSLDGRDPNGYTGVAWSVGGVHDRAWRERTVFGKIRYMNDAGCKRKFDVNGYIASVVGKIS